MRKLPALLALIVCAGFLTACTTNKQREEKYHRKIYLTEEDYTSIVESESLFCRKVDSRLSDRLVSRLEDYIVSNKEN